MTRRIQWKSPKNGEWVDLPTKEWWIACCDCGLVHKLTFRVYRGRVQIAARRHEGETRLRRKRRKEAR